MGMYCCCGAKISNNEECSCDWHGWISTTDWPPERKNRQSLIQKHPNEEGKYLVRWQDNGGDRHEEELTFNSKPYRIDTGYFNNLNIPIRWERENWEEGTPYAFKPNKDLNG